MVKRLRKRRAPDEEETLHLRYGSVQGQACLKIEGTHWPPTHFLCRVTNLTTSRGRTAACRGDIDMIDNTTVNDRTPKRAPASAPASDEARLRQQAIGVKLRQIFDEVVSEPFPDDFLDSLRRADAKSQETR